MVATIGQMQQSGILVKAADYEAPDTVTGGLKRDPLSKLDAFERIVEGDVVQVTYTTTYRNETDAVQDVVIADAYPDADAVAYEGDDALKVIGATTTWNDGNVAIYQGTRGTGALNESAWSDVSRPADDAVSFRIGRMLPGEEATVKVTYQYQVKKTVAHFSQIFVGDEPMDTNVVSFKTIRTSLIEPKVEISEAERHPPQRAAREEVQRRPRQPGWRRCLRKRARRRIPPITPVRWKCAIPLSSALASAPGSSCW